MTYSLAKRNTSTRWEPGDVSHHPVEFNADMDVFLRFTFLTVSYLSQLPAVEVAPLLQYYSQDY
jgi:hypothetical protein